MSQIECRHCGGAATLFLCNRCTSELREMLTELARRTSTRITTKEHPGESRVAPGWLELLEDAVLGQTKLGSSERRTPRYRRNLDGEKLLASQIELLPGERWEVVPGPAREGEPWPVKVPTDDEVDLNKARHDRERAALQHALGAARINLRASELLDYSRCVLTEWVRDICETRGVPVPTLVVNNELALWLARNVSAIASDEGAAVCLREIKQIVEDIERVINRPVPPRFIGPCPTETGHRQRCGFALEARRDAESIICPDCKTAYNVADLSAQLRDELDDYSFTLAELDRQILPAVCEYVPSRTLRHWAATGKLQPTGWTDDGEPKYLLADVRELKAARPQKLPTGATAHRGRTA